MADEDTDWDEQLPAYLLLERQRSAARQDLPEDLNRFYATHEGVGLQQSVDYALRLAKYEEVAIVGWEALGVPEGMPDPRWKDFRAIRIGNTNSFDTIYYVLQAPAVEPGSILAFGDIGTGPAGRDRGGTVGALVLAATLDDWIARIDQHGVEASGIWRPMDLDDSVWDEIEAELAALNPYSSHAKRRGSAAE